MKLDKIYEIVFYISNKDQKGSRLSPKDLNNLFHLVDINVMNRLLGIKSPITSITSQVIYEINQSVTEKIKRFKVIKGHGQSVPLIANNGFAVLPTDYLYPSSLSYTDETGMVIEIEALSDAEYISRQGDVLASPNADYPICNFQNSALFVKPNSISRIDFIYIRKPITAFFDYYISPTKGVIYVEEGQSYTLQTGEEAPNHPLVSVGQSFTSISKELDFKEEMHPEYIIEKLKLMGINLRDTELYQAITAQQ